MKKLLLIICSISVQFTFAQSVPFSKDVYAYDKDGLKEALKNIDEGDYLMRNENYHDAIEYYNYAMDFNEQNAELNFKIGLCYYNDIERYKSLSYFEKANALDTQVDPDINFFLGRAYHLNGFFDLALKNYNAYIEKADLEAEDRELVKKLSRECESAKLLTNKDSRAFMDNMGPNINSPYDDHSPLISADAGMLIFTSSRENGKKTDYMGLYDEDIYVSYRNGENWSVAKPIEGTVNTQYNDATVGLSPDGQTLLIYNGKRGNGDLQYTVMDGDIWDYPKNLPNEINSDYTESSACFTPDGNTLYFVSNIEGGYGGRDIWVSEKDKKGRWSDAKNLGSTINSPFDEETVFIHADGRRMYFSSKRDGTMGGYDIFVSYLQDNGQWTEPENLGTPINSPDDDLCFVMSANGRYGYVSSIRNNGEGGFDIYKMTFLGPEKPFMLTTEDNLISIREKPVTQAVMEESVTIKTIRLTIVKGVVKDAFSQEPVAANIDIIDNEKNEVIFTSKTNSSSGKFLVSLPSGKNYGLVVKADDYLFHSENFDIPSTTEYREIFKEIDLASVKKDAKIILKNVFFETGSANLQPTSYAELGRLTKMLNDYPSLKIEISGHTDNVGSASANQKLSEARAKAVVDFMISEGIASDRLSYVGHGLTQPVADNDSAEGRALNRRVEFKILSNE